MAADFTISRACTLSRANLHPVWEPRYLAASGVFGPYLALADIAVLIGGGVRRPNASRPRAPKPRRRPAGAGIMLPGTGTVEPLYRSGQGPRQRRFRRAAYRPTGRRDARSRHLVFRRRGWDAASDKIAAALAHEGAFVAGVDLPTYFRQVGAQPNARCSDAVSAIELISREIQRQRGNSNYWTPILAGVGEGGAFAAATLAQSPASTIAGAVSLDPTASR